MRGDAADRWRGGVRAGDVVVTGLGVVSCLGTSVEELWTGLCKAEQMPTSAPDDCGMAATPVVYQVAGPVASPVDRSGRRYGRASSMAVDAVGQALADAGLGAGELADAGLTVGTTLGDIGLAESGTDVAGRQFRVVGAVADTFKLGGPTASLSTACSAGAYAVSWAAELISTGTADVVIACGADAYSRVAMAALDRFGLLDHEMCRPFDVARQGMVTGEGAAAMVLESAAHAAARGAAPQAVLEGVGWSCDAHHPTAPEPGGQQLRRAVRSALAASTGRPGAAVLHRAGIEVNDVVETEAVADELGLVQAYGVKAVTGHTAGAAGVLACVVGTLILRHGQVPPNAHISTLDTRCRLPVPQSAPVPLTAPRVLVSATGFGGNNAALVLAAP